MGDIPHPAPDKAILVTSGGKIGDTIWNLATAKAVAEAEGVAVSYAVPIPFSASLPIAATQDYIAGVFVCPDPGTWYAEGEDTKTVYPSDVCRPCQAPPQGARFDKVIHLGWRRLPDAKSNEENVVVMAEGTGYTPDITKPWLRQNPSRVVKGRICLGLHDATNTYQQPHLPYLMKHLPKRLREQGWDEAMLVGGPTAEGFNLGLEKTLQQWGFRTQLQACCLACGYLAIDSCDRAIMMDSAVHAIALGMGKKTLTLRRNVFHIRTAWSTEIDCFETGENALKTLDRWLLA